MLIQRRSDLCGDILIILYWGKVTDMNNFKYTYLLKYLHIGWISLVSEINICNQIYGTITSLFQKLQKLKKLLIEAHYKSWAVFSDITKKWKYFLFFIQGALGAFSGSLKLLSCYFMQSVRTSPRDSELNIIFW